jgi:hypothetical protein
MRAAACSDCRRNAKLNSIMDDKQHILLRRRRLIVRALAAMGVAALGCDRGGSSESAPASEASLRRRREELERELREKQAAVSAAVCLMRALPPSSAQRGCAPGDPLCFDAGDPKADAGPPSAGSSNPKCPRGDPLCPDAQPRRPHRPEPDCKPGDPLCSSL